MCYINLDHPLGWGWPRKDSWLEEIRKEWDVVSTPCTDDIILEFRKGNKLMKAKILNELAKQECTVEDLAKAMGRDVIDLEIWLNHNSGMSCNNPICKAFRAYPWDCRCIEEEIEYLLGIKL